MNDKYDPVTCISAGELRAIGLPMPESIPDCGWIPRTAMEIKALESKLNGETELRINTEIKFTEPFRWITVSLTASKATDD